MRRIISLGLFALLVSIFSSTVFAGNDEDCVFLKGDDYTKGLYGLCIAYYNAGNDNARDRIAAKFNKNADPGDPTLPLTDEVPCPCWDELHLAEASLNGDPDQCSRSVNGTGTDLAAYTVPPTVATGFYLFIANGADCLRQDLSGAFFDAPFESTDQEGTCRAGIQTLVEDDFGAIVCD
jgi:hypothetical protein